MNPMLPDDSVLTTSHTLLVNAGLHGEVGLTARKALVFRYLEPVAV